jgi:hypothetical protein
MSDGRPCAHSSCSRVAYGRRVDGETCPSRLHHANVSRDSLSSVVKNDYRRLGPSLRASCRNQIDQQGLPFQVARCPPPSPFSRAPRSNHRLCRSRAIATAIECSAAQTMKWDTITQLRTRKARRERAALATTARETHDGEQAAPGIPRPCPRRVTASNAHGSIASGAR